MADNQQMPDYMALGLEPGIATIQETLGPIYKYLAPKLLGLAGIPESFTAKEQDRLSAENPKAAFLGKLGNMAATGLALPSVAGIPTVAGRMAAGAAIGAGTQVANSAAEIAHETQVDQTPLGLEQLHHAIGLPTLLAAGLGATAEGLLGLTGKTAKVAQEATKRAQGATRAAAERSAERAVALDPKTLPAAYRDGLGKRLLDEGYLEPGGTAKAAAETAAVGEARGKLAETGSSHPDWRESFGPGYDAADALERMVNDPALTASEANTPALNFLRKQAKRFASPDITLKQIYDARTDLSSMYVNRDGIKPAILKSAAHELDRIIADRAEAVQAGLGDAYRKTGGDYAFFNKLTAALEKAPRQVTPASAAVDVVAGALGGTKRVLLRGATQEVAPPGRSWALMLNKAADGLGVAAHYEGQVGEHLDALFSGKVPAMTSEFGIADLHKDYEKRRTALDRASHDAEFHGRLSGMLQDLPPPAQDAISTRLTNTLATLNQVCPKDPYGPMLAPYPWEPNDSQKFKFKEAWHTAENPFWAIHNPSPDNLKVAQELHPEIMKDVTARIQERLAESQNLPYEVKLKISRTLGGALDPSQDPKMLAALQQRIKMNNIKLQGDKAQNNQRGSARTVGATRKADKAAQTRAQRLQNEDF